jgi:hypothetical protein
VTLIDINTTTLTASAQPSLPELSGQIDKAVCDANGHAGAAVAAARRAGALLCQAKELVPHGEWADWITSNTKLSMRSAQAYMRLAGKLDMLPPEHATAVAHLPLREAMKAITTPAEAPWRAKTSKVINRFPPEVLQARSVCAAAHRTLGSFTKNVGLGKAPPDQIKALRERLRKLLDALDTLDRIAAEGSA